MESTFAQRETHCQTVQLFLFNYLVANKLFVTNYNLQFKAEREHGFLLKNSKAKVKKVLNFSNFVFTFAHGL